MAEGRAELPSAQISEPKTWQLTGTGGTNAGNRLQKFEVWCRHRLVSRHCTPLHQEDLGDQEHGQTMIQAMVKLRSRMTWKMIPVQHQKPSIYTPILV